MIKGCRVTPFFIYISFYAIFEAFLALKPFESLKVIEDDRGKRFEHRHNDHAWIRKPKVEPAP